jgi:hypothetical protein
MAVEDEVGIKRIADGMLFELTSSNLAVGAESEEVKTPIKRHTKKKEVMTKDRDEV